MSWLNTLPGWILFGSVVVSGTVGLVEQCDKDSSVCEFFLDVEHWLPMRLEFMQKVYINSTNGKLYKYDDETNAEVSPDEVVLADGSEEERVLALFNKTMPGPTLIVYKNQEVIVHVKNLMLSEGVSVHFHGIEMRGTPWMDGAAFVTQCPIMPGQTFTYRFRPDRSGTFYYHAHFGMQMSMGLVAPFIVKEINAEAMEEHIMVIQDYNNRYTGDDQAMSGRLGTFYADGVGMPFSNTIDGYLTTLLELSSTLINGLGRVYDENGEATTHTPLSVFRVTSGTRYRFRVIGAGYALQNKISVDGHRLEIIAMDGHNIEPVTADFVLLHSGERVDFIINANQATDNYWIRVETLKVSNGQPAYAILRYENATSVEPSTHPIECTETMSCVAVNCPIPSFTNWTCINVENLNNLKTDDSAPVPESPGKFKEFFINFGFARDEKRRVFGHANGVSFQPPSVSALTQPREVTGICDETDKCGQDKLCFCNQPLDVKYGDIVQLNFLNIGINARFHHPVHVHGYSFHVIKVGYGEINQTATNGTDYAALNRDGHIYDNADVHCHSLSRSKSLCNNVTWSNNEWNGGHILGQKISKAIRKDTVTVPANGYVSIRFKADNPGLWLIHCHQELHTALRGMGFMMNDSFSQVPSPPEGFPECRSFPPSKWLTEPKETTTPSQSTDTSTSTETMKEEKAERTFTEEEFWGMVGAFLFVIILQFFMTVCCLLRRNGSSGKYAM